MSLHTKTSYVKPHTKTSYIRPLCDNDESNKIQKDLLCTKLDAQEKSGSLLNMDKENLFGSSKQLTKNTDEKEKNLQKLNSAYSSLLQEIEKIQTWKNSIQLEYKQKSKKFEELNKIVESQRKVVLDLQMQNENLSMQLSDEIQKRVCFLEKFSATKELCSALKHKFQDLQLQLDSRNKIEEVFTTSSQERTKILEDLTDKFNIMKIEFSEKITNLNSALSNEKENTLRLADLCKEQCVTAENEHKAYCNLIEKYQKELLTISKEIQDQKQQTACLEKEKACLHVKISELENTNEMYLNKLKETEEKLKLTEASKLEIENNFNAESVKVKDMNMKCKELEEFISNLKSEFKEKFATLETNINCLEETVIGKKQKLEEYETKNEDLLQLVQEMENEKCALKNKILSIESEKIELTEKFKIDSENAAQIIDQLMKEKDELNTVLQIGEEEMHKTVSEKESIAKVCSENEEKLLEITKAYEISVSKVQELCAVEKQYFEALNKIKELEDNIQTKSGLLTSKELEIHKMHSLDQKYTECLTRIKELEDELQLKSELLLTKELKIEELSTVEELYSKVLIKFKEMEVEIKDKYEILDLKDKTIAELNTSLNEKVTVLEALQYENMEMKEAIIKDKESVKICLECEVMVKKVKEYDELMTDLKTTKQELMNQRQITSDTVKMLNETEDNFDEMRIRKEKEIIKHKEKVQTLQHEVNMLKVQVENLKKFEEENERLQMNIDDISLQNAGDLQRLKAENEKLRKEMEVLKTGKTDTKNKSPSQQNMIFDEKMEADSSCDEVMIINKEIKATSTPKRPNKLTTKKATNVQKQPTVVPTTEKRKRNWESESSGSECLEIVYDKDAKTVKGFASKGKSLPDLKKTPRTPAGNRFNFEQMKMRNATSINNKQTPNFSEGMKCTSKTPENNLDFLNSKNGFQEPNNEDSPWIKRKTSLDKIPATPIQRKFFKTPLKERDMPFKKPQTYKPWI